MMSVDDFFKAIFHGVHKVHMESVVKKNELKSTNKKVKSKKELQK